MTWFTITLHVKAWPVAFALRAQATTQAFTFSIIVNQITPLTIFGYKICQNNDLTLFTSNRISSLWCFVHIFMVAVFCKSTPFLTITLVLFIYCVPPAAGAAGAAGPLRRLVL